MTVFLIVFAVGVFVGWFLRGCVAKTNIAKLRNQHEEAKVITDIERERLKVDRMIRERMQSDN